MTETKNKKLIYFGPPLGMYEHQRFHNIVNNDLKERINKNLIPTAVDIAYHGKITITHFKDAHAWLEYHLMDDNRASVYLLVCRNKIGHLEKIFGFITEIERERIK